MASRIKAAVEAGKTKREEEKESRRRLAELRKDYAASDATHSGGGKRVEGQTNPTFDTVDTKDRAGEVSLLKSKTRGGNELSREVVQPPLSSSAPAPSKVKNKTVFQNGGDVEAPNAGIKALRKQADGGNKNAKKALQNIGYKNGGCVMTKTNQSPKLY